MYKSKAHIAKFACRREKARKTSITIPLDKGNGQDHRVALLTLLGLSRLQKLEKGIS